MTDIFLTDEDPYACAESLCDQHLILQISHVASILSTLASRLGVTGVMYGEPIKEKNVIVEWAVKKEERGLWVSLYAACLIAEYESRFGLEETPDEFGVIASCNQLLIMIHECGKEEEEQEVVFPNVWWSKDPFNKYKEKLTEELHAINCAWTKSYPPYWLKKSGIKLTRKGDRIFKQ